MKKYINLGLVAATMLFFGCDFDDTNVDPNNLSQQSVQLKDVLPTAQAQTMYNIGALGGRMPGILTQHFFGFDAQQVPYSTYGIGESDLNNLWVTGLYVGSMKDAEFIIERAQEQEQPQYEGIAKVLLAQNLGLATQFWGDVPYTQALDPVEFPKPAFDTQESVYNSIQTLLDEAITLLGQPVPATDFVGGDDLIYGGDKDMWIKAANALKARYWIQLTERNPNAAQNALNAINGALDGVAEEPMFFFDGAVTGANPYAQFGAQRPKTLIVADEFADLLMGRNDPRMPLYMAEDGDEWLFYAGQSGSGLFWSQNASPLPLISYVEQKFIEAEALLRTDNASGAEEALEDAVQASMDQLGVAADEAADYVDEYANFDEAGTFEERLEKIIVEKYIALYAQAEPEVWSDWRRTGYPELTPRPGGVNGNNPSGVIPERFLYPLDERVTNTENWQEAVDRQGGQLLDDELWAFPN